MGIWVLGLRVWGQGLTNIKLSDKNTNDHFSLVKIRVWGRASTGDAGEPYQGKVETTVK